MRCVKEELFQPYKGLLDQSINDRPPMKVVGKWPQKKKWTFDDMLSIRKPNVAEIFGNDSASSRLIIEV